MTNQKFQEAVTRVATLIRNDKRYDDALELIGEMPTSWTEREGMKNLKLLAHLRRGDHNAVTDILLERSSISEWAPWAATAAYRSATKATQQIRYDRQTHDLLWGPPKPSIREALQVTAPVPIDDQHIQSVMKVVENVTGQAISDREHWEQRFRLGISRELYFLFLNRLAKAGVANLDPQVRELVRQKQEAMGVVSSDIIEENLQSGRSVVLLQLHAGFRGAVMTAISGLDWPLSIIDNGARSVARGSDFHVRTNQPRTNFDFMHLCKLIRRSCRIVSILPDGPEGQNKAITEIGGAEVSVGLGAAHLAYLGKAAFVFGRSRWSDDGVNAEFTRGPVVEQHDDKEAVEEKLISFYRQCVIDVLTGDPVDSGMRGGYWQAFGEIYR